MKSRTAEMREAIEQMRSELAGAAQAAADKAGPGGQTDEAGPGGQTDEAGPAPRRRFTVPLGAAMAGAGGVFLALRLKSRTD